MCNLNYLFFNFTQFVILGNVSVLELVLLGVKELRTPILTMISSQSVVLNHVANKNLINGMHLPFILHLHRASTIL